MPDLYFEDFTAGDVLDFAAAKPVTKEAIIAYAEQYDPQPFHLDEVAAKDTMLGGLAASGWHSCCILMRLNYDHWLDRTASMGAPGIDEVRWVKPVRPGDMLHVRRTILETRVSSSRPQMGFVTMTCDMTNAAGETVLTQRHSQMIELRRPAAAEPKAASVQTKPPSVPTADAASNATKDDPFTGYFEDVKIGVTRHLGDAQFTKENIVAFARDYDPQPFHMNEDAARKSHFGRLAASGWQTGSLWMRLAILARDKAQREKAAQGIETPALGPSPGFTNLRWIKPVYAGDTISYSSCVVEKRKTSRPGWGLMFSDNAGVNQHGERVYEFRGSAFVRLRGG